MLWPSIAAWVKKEERNFNVTMGAYNGAEVCELVSIFVMSPLGKHINKNHIGPYSDDGLVILKNTSGLGAE